MPTLPDSLVAKLRTMAGRLEEIDGLLATPEIASNPSQIRSLSKERGGFVHPVDVFTTWSTVARELAEAEEMIADEQGDREIKEMAESERDKLTEREAALAQQLQEILVLEEPDETRDVLIEIRAGTGGGEAALFAGDLYRMYTLYAEEKGWKVEVISENRTDLGGVKEAVLSIQGDNVYRFLRLESGTHRVQRIPVTEAGGRIHTSAATIAVLPEVEDVEIVVKDDELKIDTFCASGPGGQHVNKTASAVRITHLPTGTVVSCQDEKSQHRNKNRALRVLRSRLYKIRKEEQDQAIAAERRGQIGKGDRSEKIRTYNFPQSRVTDHRAGISKFNLQEILQGKLEDVIEPLLVWDKQEKLKNL